MYRIHCLLLLLLCTCVPALVTAQDAERPLYYSTFFNVAEGKTDAAQELLAELIQVYYDNGMTARTKWFRYDDGRLEAFMPIRDYAEMDRLDAQFNLAMSSMDSTLRKTLFDREKYRQLIPSQQSNILRGRPDLSYRPESDSDEETEHIVIYKYELLPGVSFDSLQVHAKMLADMMKEVDAQFGFDFLTYEFGETNRTFEVNVYAESPEALDRARQSVRQALGKRYDEWQQKRDRLVRETGEATATYLPEMSQSAPEKTESLLLVQIATPREGAADELLRLREQMAALSAGTGDKLYYNTYRHDDGKLYFVGPLERMSDVDKIYDNAAARNAYVDQDKSKPLRQRYKELLMDNQVTVMRRPTELSYQPEGVDMSKYNFYRHAEYEYDMKDADEVYELAKEIIRINKERKATIPVAIYFYALGGGQNRLIVHDAATSREALEKGIARDRELMKGPDRDKWKQRVDEVLREVSVTYGQHVPKASYPKPKATK